MKHPVAVQITSLHHSPYRIALNISPAQPHERANPRRHTFHVQKLARRERVEIPYENVETILMLLNIFEQRLDFTHALALAPFRESRAQVQPEDARASVAQNDFKKRVASAFGPVPFVASDL